LVARKENKAYIMFMSCNNVFARSVAKNINTTQYYRISFCLVCGSELLTWHCPGVKVAVQTLELGVRSVQLNVAVHSTMKSPSLVQNA
jgi:hypothetical protein